MNFRSLLVVPTFLVLILPLASSQAGSFIGSHAGDPRFATSSDAGAVPKAKSGRTRYAAIVARHARANGVPVALADAVVSVESRYNPRVTGRAGEIGLMQIKLQTARGMGYRGTRDGLFDPETNVKYGMKYLGGAHKRGGGSTCGTILKYQGGHYATRMAASTRKYCAQVQRMMARG